MAKKKLRDMRCGDMFRDSDEVFLCGFLTDHKNPLSRHITELKGEEVGCVAKLQIYYFSPDEEYELVTGITIG